VRVCVEDAQGAGEGRCNVRGESCLRLCVCAQVFVYARAVIKLWHGQLFVKALKTVTWLCFGADGLYILNQQMHH